MTCKVQTLYSAAAFVEGGLLIDLAGAQDVQLHQDMSLMEMCLEDVLHKPLQVSSLF